MPILSKVRIVTAFEQYRKNIFTPEEVLKIIAANIESWKLDRQRNPKNDDEFHIRSDGPKAVLEYLKKQTLLTEINLPFPYRRLRRYTRNPAETWDIIQSINPQGYFSHYSAMSIHGLTEQTPKTIYFNIEQPATGGGGTLTQEGINRAFAGKCRMSNNRINFRDITIHLLNGQNTGRLGVIETNFNGSTVWVTDIERTLIDATVRTIYAGGIGEVANAYSKTAEKLSVEKMSDYLRDLNYTYPYHQAIGYYLERTGKFTDSELRPLLKYPIEFDFYITYQVRNPAYNEKWRLFIPKGF
ncbi:MAG TPA: hypothetical protein PKD64_02270 [Pirellulaceae bacterium]|nr:hypothetical protein [Pirellulaceae bacterium]HMO90994.1 hypothetical protein [Pirellulaceae bacterium]HMP68109.1 hypothetical protein [Pirellulaceae bacterium]